VTAPEAVVVSYRLGGADGVAVEAAKWEWALRELGFTVRRVAGEFESLRPDDTWLPFLAIEPVPGARIDAGALGAAIAGADLVVVENLCSLPLNVEAATVTRDVLDAHRGRVCFHHHDFAWERPHLAHLDAFPPKRANSLHVTVSEHGRRDLEARGFHAVCVHNSFDFDAPLGDREGTRSDLGVTADTILLVQPTRAIPRKNVAGGLRFAAELATRLESVDVQYWITGPAEDGFDDEFARLLAHASIPVHVGRARRPADAYAAADLVVFPSTWEGFGNPVIESTAARRMLAVGKYPALGELVDGLHVLPVNDVAAALEWLLRPRADIVEHNFAHARARFSLEHLPARIEAALLGVGWAYW
jgi:glycosyltransferase involved in cell wall biosynthesis